MTRRLVRFLGCTLIPVLFSLTGLSQSELIFPRVSFEPDDIVGLAIVNPEDTDASVELTALGADGVALSGNGFMNPVTILVPNGQQFSRTAAEIFGATVSQSVSWVRATSDSDNLTGFFLSLNTAVTVFDGSDLPPASSIIVFNEIRLGEGTSSEINVVNPSDGELSVRLVLRGGESPVIVDQLIPAGGVLRADATELFFPGESSAGTTVPEAVFVQAFSAEPIAGFALVQGAGDFLGSAARPDSEALNTLFFPQMAVLDPFISEVVIENYSRETALLTITAFQEDGTPYGPENTTENPVTRVLEGQSVTRENVEELFGFSGQGPLEGWMRVESTSEAVNGSISYAIPASNSVAAVAAQAAPTPQAVFSHIATTLGFFTGVAVLNGGTMAANIRILAARSDGTSLGTFTTTLRPGERMSDLISDLIPAAAGRGGGFVWLSSDIPVYATSLFGNLASGVLANVPPQSVPQEFAPDLGQPRLSVDPPLAAVQPGGSQTFALVDSSAAPAWSVNGVPGGGPSVGTIDGNGRYTAPQFLPDRLPITIEAQSGPQLAGASVDVITREILAGNLGLVQSVAFVAGLDRLFTAELTVGGTSTAERPAGGFGSIIFDVSNGVNEQVAAFPGEDIAKIIGYRASDNRDYLLATARASGSIIRLDPISGAVTDVATGFDNPSAIAFDDRLAELLVASNGGLSTVSASALNIGLPGGPLESGPVDSTGGPAGPFHRFAGVAFDRCTGHAYLAETGSAIFAVNPATGESSPLSTPGLIPGQMLAVYRSGVPCPQSLHLLVVNESDGTVWIVVPGLGLAQPWLATMGLADLSYTPGSGPGPAGNLLPSGEALIVAEIVDNVGRVSTVPLPELYEQAASNPPPTGDLPQFGLVVGAEARSTFEQFRDNEGDTFIDFNDLSVGTLLDTQLAGLGVIFHTISDTRGNPITPGSTIVSAAFANNTSFGNSIVGRRLPAGEDGRPFYQIDFSQPHQRVAMQRIFGPAVTRFYNSNGDVLAEHGNELSFQFVGYISSSTNENDWVARVELRGRSGETPDPQTGYTDDLFFGSSGSSLVSSPIAGPRAAGIKRP